jgi:hypothetical protein
MNRSFQTAKGTELPLLNLRGSDYLEVKYRLVWFREEHPTWSIETEFVSMTDRTACARAVIRDESGRIIATSHKAENSASFPDFMEKAETGAIGRALALIGYGTQFCAEELDEGDRIVDSPVRPRSGSSSGTAFEGSAPEVVRASSMGLTSRVQPPGRTLNVDPGEFVVHFGKKYMGRKIRDIPRRDIESYVQWLEDSSAKKNQPAGPDVALLKQAVDRFYHPEKYETPAAGEGLEAADETQAG